MLVRRFVGYNPSTLPPTEIPRTRKAAARERRTPPGPMRRQAGCPEDLPRSSPSSPSFVTGRVYILTNIQTDTPSFFPTIPTRAGLQGDGHVSLPVCPGLNPSSLGEIRAYVQESDGGVCIARGPPPLLDVAGVLTAWDDHTSASELQGGRSRAMIVPPRYCQYDDRPCVLLPTA